MTTPANGIGSAYDRLIDTRIAECFLHLDPEQPMPPAPVAAAVDIVIPVHDAYDAFSECLRSVLEHTDARHRLVLIDDASRDPRVREAMRHAANTRSNTQVIEQTANLGYLQTVNQAILASSRDIVLLNSDAMVAAGWLDGLARAAHAAADIGIACPLSDHATILSVIDPAEAQTAAQRIGTVARDMHPLLPVAVGFCMYVRRAVFEAIGVFDAAFDPGYGEETDFSLRAWRAGFAITAAPDVLVRHRSGSSFGHAPEIQRRRLVHERLMAARWPGYESIVRTWWRDWPLREQAERLRATRPGQRERILHVVHRASRLGGTELHTRALVGSIGRRLDVDLIAPEAMPVWTDAIERERGDGWRLHHVNSRNHVANQRLFGVAADLSDPGVERQFLRTLIGGGHSLVHVHSLLHWNSLLLPELARQAGARVVLTLHDLSLLCPDYTLAPAPAFTVCGRSHAGVQASCLDCLGTHHQVRPGANVPDLATYLGARRHFWRRALLAADAIIAPSVFVFDRIRAAYGDAIGDRALVIPHGLAHVPTRLQRGHGRVLRIGYFGGQARIKGIDLVLAIAVAMQEEPVHFIVYGIQDRSALPAELPANLEWHGAFLPEAIDGMLANIDLALIPSQVEETFSLVLSECRAAGVPVIASRIGALGERIRDTVDGWLLPPHVAAPWITLLGHLCSTSGRSELERVAGTCAASPIRRVDEEADEYLALYESLPRPAPRIRTTRIAGEDIASRRLRTQLRALQTLPTSPPWLDAAVAPATFRADASTRLFVLVRCEAHNRARLGETLDAVGSIPGVSSCVLFIGDPRNVSPPACAEWIDAGKTDARQRMLDFTHQGRGPNDWHVVLDAGDRLHSDVLHWLSRCPAGDIAACSDWDLREASGRHYTAVATPAWDPWLAQGSTAYAQALFVRGNALDAYAGWEPSAVAAFGLQLRLARERRTPCMLGRVLVHVADSNLSPQQRETQQKALLTALALHLESTCPGTLAVSAGDHPGWTITPPVARAQSVVALVWDTRTVDENSLRALERMTDWANFRAIAWTPGSLLPEVDHFVFWKNGNEPEHVDWLARLLAWLQQSGIAAVAPRRIGPAGQTLASGLDFDGRSLRWLDDTRLEPGITAEAWSCSVRHMPALSTHCLLVRSGLIDVAIAEILAAPDSLASVHVQLQWQREDALNLLRVPDVHLRQPRRGEFAQADDGTLSTSVRATWRDLPRTRRAALPLRRLPRAGMSAGSLPATRPRIAALTRDDWASSQYRVLQPLRALSDAGLIDASTLWRLRHEGAPGILELEAEAPDALLLHHALDDRSLDLMEDVARDMAIPRVLVIDDLLTAVPDSNPMSRQLFPDIADRLQRALALCSCLVVTTPELANAYGARAPRTLVIGNALPKSPWLGFWLADHEQREPADRRLRVGWAGAQQHAKDLEILEALLPRHRDLQWVFLGMAPANAHALGAEVHDMVPFADYPQRLAGLELDIALVPLEDNPFNRCKSALKLLEFGALHIAVIASAIAPYLDAPVLHARADIDSWDRALTTLKRDPIQRAKASRNLHDWVMSRHLLPSRIDAWCDALSIPTHQEILHG